MADTKTVTIQGVEVNVSQPYAEGHAITEAEAKALNQVRAENIANNKRKAIKDMIEEAGGEITDAITKAAQKLVSAYDAEYVFTLAAAAAAGGGRMDPLTKECRRLAREQVNFALREAGMTQRAYKEQKGEDAIENLIAQYQDNEQIVAQAKLNVEKAKELTQVKL